MVELVITGIFAAALLICVFADISVLYPLVFGYFLFSGYALSKGQSVKKLLSETANGIMTIKNIIMTFIFIGMMTGIWRACGTIAFIVYHASDLCTPSVMLMASFILCALLSVLTGTSFGTAATMGVICATMANNMGLPPLLYGGAILSGSFFGDRCSPMSTSALLVSELTGSDIYTNIKNMAKTAAVPAVLTCAVYAALGRMCGASGAGNALASVFERSFDLSALTLAPAAAIIILSCMRFNVKIAMSVSIAAGIFTGAFVQHMSAPDIIHVLIMGFTPRDADLAAVMSGGGIISMARVAAIVCISASYAGIFDGTGFLEGIRSVINRLCEKTSAFAGTLITSAVTSMVACNQTLAIMLTYQLCSGAEPDRKKLALYLEDSVVLIAAMIPWSIAAAVPLAAAGAPSAGVIAAVYLYLQPLCGLFIHRSAHRKATSLVE